MPTVNIYYKTKRDGATLKPVIPKLKTYLAKKLTCGEIKLRQDEISVRPIKVEGNGMLGRVEVDIVAHEFAERVKNQDKICFDTKQWLEKEARPIDNFRVWLNLGQLGHDVLPT
ncbi:MAG: hypothetical protein ABR981_01540 [Candidatus Micrarchaeaceae archaeon]|jgi:hypothetical protein